MTRGLIPPRTEQEYQGFRASFKYPCLRPATPQEAYELTKLAFELSREFEIPVIPQDYDAGFS